jgi:SAM-dependent methyltransferase
LLPSVDELDARYLPSAPDDHAMFDQAVRRHLAPDAVLLDAGAGRGTRNRHPYKGLVARLVGVDLTPGIRENDLVHHAILANVERLPFRDATFDLVISKFMVEHLDSPLGAFRELRRVTKPGGVLVIHTPNRYHYVAVIARLTPERFHEWFNACRGRDEVDTIPTRYRANDRRTLERLAHRSGYRVERLQLVEPRPSYLEFHPLAYLAGIAYARVVSSGRLRDLRCDIVAELRAIR